MIRPLASPPTTMVPSPGEHIAAQHRLWLQRTGWMVSRRGTPLLAPTVCPSLPSVSLPASFPTLSSPHPPPSILFPLPHPLSPSSLPPSFSSSTRSVSSASLSPSLPASFPQLPASLSPPRSHPNASISSPLPRSQQGRQDHNQSVPGRLTASCRLSSATCALSTMFTCFVVSAFS